MTREVVSLQVGPSSSQNDGAAEQQVREPKFEQPLVLTMPWIDDSDEVAVCLDAQVLTALNLDSSRYNMKAFYDELRQRAVMYLGTGSDA